MRILVATDGSDAANRAFEFAAGLSRDVGGSLKIVHVIGPFDRGSEQLAEFSRQEHVGPKAFSNSVWEETLVTAERRATELGVSDIRSACHRGNVAASIIDVARRDKADVIVLGKRGLGRVSGVLLGSVSQKVVASAPCAVVVVP